MSDAPWNGCLVDSCRRWQACMRAPLCESQIAPRPPARIVAWLRILEKETADPEVSDMYYNVANVIEESGDITTGQEEGA